ncbi:MAG: sigma-54 dependent transcriptional regulator [Planctomycetota bacterium]|jgi:DNA-binding NtrC family response regulator|nr:sigma-54 dependent transcriptional regulator [Planctomycetota bacterium]
MTMHKTVLVVDDNENIYKSLRLNFRQRGLDCVWAKNGGEALEAARNGDVAVVLLDLSLGAEYGIDVMRDLSQVNASLPVIIITGYGTFEAAVKAVKLGASDFLAKPLEFAKLYAAVTEAMKVSPEGGDKTAEPHIITDDKTLKDILRRAAQLAKIDIAILVTGESGTGKELLASMLHAESPRSGRPFLRINCSAFADTLVDNELFGHEKGSFTGAHGAHPGLFEQADTGTLHLDEIGDMSLATQAKLLRALEEGVVRRIGGVRDIGVDVRVVASTNKNLEDLILAGAFRQDLFYRLNAVTLWMPPLRERTGDVPLLLEHFLAEFAEGEPKSFSEDAVAILAAYPWPGNVRELRNLVKVCSLVSESDVIDADDLPAYVRHPSPSRSGRLNIAERDVIQRTLLESQGNKSLAAERLGISRRTLYNKMERYGIT